MPRVLFGVTVAMTAQAFLRDQMNELAVRGWDVHLACSPDDGTGSFAQLRELPDVTLHALPMARPPRPLQDIRSLRAWLRLLGAVQPDVVVASTPKAGLLGTLAARLRRVPARIYHVRGLRAEGLRGPLASASLASERIAIASATHVLVDSPSLLATMRRDGLLNTDEGLVLGSGSCCGVDTEHFHPPSQDERDAARSALGFADDDIVIGFVGRLATDKGIPELIAAANQTQATDPRVRLALIGPAEGDTSFRGALQAAVSAGWAVAPGPTSDPRSSYWAFDIFCLPSHREGFPIAPLEAQACGLPVVTTDATGCVDTVTSNVTGVAVAIGDVAQLASALRTLAVDGELRLRMGNDARSRVVQDFDQRAVRERVVEFIQQSTTTATSTGGEK